MIVIDASAALSALLNEGAARELIGSEQLHAPHLIDSEIASGLRRMVLGRELPVEAGGSALIAWGKVAVTRYPLDGLLERIWQLRENLSAYDAGYVALTESLGSTLLTANGRLARASGARCPITVVPR